VLRTVVPTAPTDLTSSSHEIFVLVFINVGLTRRRVAPKRHTASVPSEDRGLLLELACTVKARSA
jgi:hypothetical protein